LILDTRWTRHQRAHVSTMEGKLPASAVYVTEKAEIADDGDDNFSYGEVPVETVLIDYGIGETFGDTLKLVQDAKLLGTKPSLQTARLNNRPEVVEDYIRNFLLRNGMTTTLAGFQAEWYQRVQKGQIVENDGTVIPDCYIRNNALLDEIETHRMEADMQAKIAQKAEKESGKLKKERDYHRLAHRRVQEENKELQREIARLHQHYEGVEEHNSELQGKYESVKRTGVVVALERDRTQKEAMGLSQKLEELAALRTTQVIELDEEGNDAGAADGDTTPAPPAEMPEFAATATRMSMAVPAGTAKPLEVADPVTLERARSMGKALGTFQAHGAAVGALAYHGASGTLATASDDNSFKLWELGADGNGALLLEGKGHDAWIGGLAFHPQGSVLATGSGDATVKVWDLETAECYATFAEHTHAVWDTAFHYTGDFVASASMDNTAKLWDLESLTCKTTMRGHKDSVNSIEFQNFSNTLVTGSADAAVMLWDARTGLASQTLAAHRNAVNHAIFNNAGDKIASVDADGVVALWDVRTCSRLATANVGGGAGNRVAFDPSGQTLAVASLDTTTKLLDAATLEMVSKLEGHYDGVLSVLFEPSGKFAITSAADGTVRCW